MPNGIPQGYNVFFDILQEIQDEGIALPFRPTLNFIGTGVVASEDVPNNRINVDIPGNVQPHNLLDGSQNQDTVANPATAGDLIIGNASPLWDVLPIGTPGQVLTQVAGFPAWVTPTPATNFYQTIQDEGIALPQQPTFNFIGAIVTAVDDPGNNRTNITIAGGGGGDNTVIFGFNSDGSISAGPDEFGGWFSDDATSNEFHAQSFVAFAYTVVRATCHIGANSSDDQIVFDMRNASVDVPNTEIIVPSSTTGSFDTGVISQAISAFDLTNVRFDRQGSSTVSDYNYFIECEK